MMDFMKKRICLDEGTLKNLHGMKADRRRLGLTQKQLSILSGIPLGTLGKYESGYAYPMLARYILLSEILGWDMTNDPNYFFYHEYQSSSNRMQAEKRRYAYTNIELSRDANLSEEAVRHVIKKKRAASVSNYMRVRQILNEEARLAEFRRRQV